jgi:hypothetical protein
LGGTLILATFVAVPFEADAAETELTLSFTGLEDLGPSWAYEGWLIVDGAPVSTGVFTVDANGTPSATSFIVDSNNLNQASAFVLTIEPSPDSDPAPAPVHLLGGDFNNGVANLSVGHTAALGDSFSNATGSYVLAAPSGGDVPHVNGIWWLDPAAGPGAALNLPTLPAGWVYEGWVVGSEGPISTGRFTSVSGADSDGAGPTGGPTAAPLFPGQDFVNPPTDLTDGFAAVISIEPEPDNDPAPFTLKPLVDDPIEDVGPMTLQVMTNNANTFPTGMASSTTMAAEAPAALPVTGVDQSLPISPVVVLAGGLLLLAVSFALRSYLR